MRQLPEIPDENNLALAVRWWINHQAESRDDTVEGVLRDMWDLEPSLVSDLGRFINCADFYEGCQPEIAQLAAGWYGEGGGCDGPSKETGGRELWDESDPLAATPHNQKVLAWWGFGRALAVLAMHHGIEAE